MNFLSFSFIFAIASILRFALVLVNRHANDDHIGVVMRMLSGLSVDRSACYECFQPKLYHGTVAFLAYLFSVRSYLSLTILGEFLSTAAGIASLVIIWQFIAKQKA